MSELNQLFDELSATVLAGEVCGRDPLKRLQSQFQELADLLHAANACDAGKVSESAVQQLKASLRPGTTKKKRSDNWQHFQESLNFIQDAIQAIHREKTARSPEPVAPQPAETKAKAEAEIEIAATPATAEKAVPAPVVAAGELDPE